MDVASSSRCSAPRRRHWWELFTSGCSFYCPTQWGWRGYAPAGWCPTSRTLADELEFLIRTQWLTQSEAANRRAVKCAIARVVTQN